MILTDKLIIIFGVLALLTKWYQLLKKQNI